MAVRHEFDFIETRGDPVHHRAMSVGQTYQDHNRNMVQAEYRQHITATRLLCVRRPTLLGIM